MQNLVTIVILLILLTLLPPAGSQPSSRTCAIHTAANGRRQCICIAHRPGSRKQAYPLFVCHIVNR